MFENVKRELGLYDVNRLGQRVTQKILVFESDDWGSTRMTGKRAYDYLFKLGVPVHKSAYCKYDILESTGDVAALADILNSFKNVNQEKPKFTLNFVTANPDFEKIRDSGLKEYFYKPFTQAYKNSEFGENAFQTVQKGVQEGLFMPQFHGRDHVNVPLWLGLLNKHDIFQKAFEFGVWGLSQDVFPEITKSIQATYDSQDLHYTKNSIVEGLELFHSLFGFKSESFIANNYIWDDALNEVLDTLGVKHFQTMKYQLLPKVDGEKRTMIRRPYGSMNIYGQTYAPRNCTFEPTERGDTHLNTLKQIKRAFLYKKPAIISTHRVNYVSGMDVNNRDKNLEELNKLLKKIIQIWPDVTFVTSDQLHEMIVQKMKKN